MTTKHTSATPAGVVSKENAVDDNAEAMLFTMGPQLGKVYFVVDGNGRRVGEVFPRRWWAESERDSIANMLISECRPYTVVEFDVSDAIRDAYAHGAKRSVGWAHKQFGNDDFHLVLCGPNGEVCLAPKPGHVLDETGKIRKESPNA